MRMRAHRSLGLLLLIGAMLMAPLLCVRFCELQHMTAVRPERSPAELARLHALGHHEREAESRAHHRALLNRLKQMVVSLTEFVLMTAIASGVVVAVLWAPACLPSLYTPFIAVPTPPPR